MKAPVRMVCGDCLRSVELTPDDVGRLPTLCPVCGGTIDSRLSEMETPTSNFTLPLGYQPAQPGETPWTETWTKGSLGTVGRFQLREMLGDGGFGQVYQAYDPRLDRDVALKVLKQSDPGERVMERFFREARAAARLSHPNIVAVHDAGSDDGKCWIAYEFVDGHTLARQLDHQKMDLPTALRITRDLADALIHAHNAQVFHRDVKPANVLLDAAGRARLIDFGLARRADLDSDLTRDGAVLGTPAYMSPEQASGRSHQADERSDVYSLGVMLFELLCGRRPFEAPSDIPIWQAKPTAPTPSPRSFNRKVPVALERIVLKALAVNPEDRYPDAKAFGRELDRWIKSREAPTGFSHPLTCIVMGIAGSLLLMVALNAMFDVSSHMHPAKLAEAPPSATVHQESSGQRPPLAIDSRKALFSATASGFIGNSKTHTYHRPTCSDARTIKEINLVRLGSEQEASGKGFTACKHCNPDKMRSPSFGAEASDKE